MQHPLERVTLSDSFPHEVSFHETSFVEMLWLSDGSSWISSYCRDRGRPLPLLIELTIVAEVGWFQSSVTLSASSGVLFTISSPSMSFQCMTSTASSMGTLVNSGDIEAHKSIHCLVYGDVGEQWGDIKAEELPLPPHVPPTPYLWTWNSECVSQSS